MPRTVVDRAQRLHVTKRETNDASIARRPITMSWLCAALLLVLLAPPAAAVTVRVDAGFGLDGLSVGPPGRGAGATPGPDGGVFAGNVLFSAIGELDRSRPVDPPTPGCPQIRGLDKTVAAPGGILVQAATVLAADGTNSIGATRILPDGHTDRSFGCGGVAAVTVDPASRAIAVSVAVDPSGRIVSGALLFDPLDLTSSGVRGCAIARFTPGGAPDTSFGVGGVVYMPRPRTTFCASAVAAQTDGKIIVGGSDKTSTAVPIRFDRLTVNGGLDPTFGSGGVVRITPAVPSRSGAAREIVITNSGKIVAVGGVERAPGEDFVAVRLLADGTPDPDFGSGGVVITDVGDMGERQGAATAVVSPDGSLIAAGTVLRGGQRIINIVRYTISGTLDAEFGDNGIRTDATGDADATVAGITLDATGRLAVTGFTTLSLPAVQCTFVIRYLLSSTSATATGSTGGDLDRCTRRAANFVALGDSVSAGEGIAYDYRWSSANRQWIRFGPAAPAWDTRYTVSECHQTAQAHPRVTANLLSVTLLHLSCTGSTARNGVLGQRVVNGDAWRAPAQLGTRLAGFAAPNTRYDAAEPDIVSLSLGANDIDFQGLVMGCYAPAIGGCGTDDARLDASLAAQKADLTVVLEEIARRAPSGKRPLTIVTQYVDPFPSQWTDDCRDLDIPIFSAGLSKREMDFLRRGLTRLNKNIAAVATDQGAFVLAPPRAFRDHVFCSPDPWTFGPSIAADRFGPDANSPAPFHPTVSGQRAIGRDLESLVRTRLAVRAGSNVRVATRLGRVTFAEVSIPGEMVIVPDDAGLVTLPPASSFVKTQGFEIATSAVHSGGVEVSLPSNSKQDLFHYESGRWVKVSSTYADYRVTGIVGSLSPFALGSEVSPVRAQVADVPSGEAPLDVAFDAQLSAVADGSGIATFTWDFGDGTSGAGATPTHRYRQSGMYEARVKVLAANGAEDEATVAVTVTNRVPIAAATVPSSATVGQVASFDADGSFDPNGILAHMTWDYGDGSRPASGRRVTHVYDAVGVYNVTLTAVDDEGEAADAHYTIRIDAAPSPASADPPGLGAPSATVTVPGAVVPPPTVTRRGVRVRIIGKLKRDRVGRLVVEVGCGEVPCRGVLLVTPSRSRSTRLARKVIAIPARERRTYRLRLAKSALARLPRSSRIRVSIRVKGAAPVSVIRRMPTLRRPS